MLINQQEPRSATSPSRFSALDLDCSLSSSCLNASYAKVQNRHLALTSRARSLVGCPSRLSLGISSSYFASLKTAFWFLDFLETVSCSSTTCFVGCECYTISGRIPALRITSGYLPWPFRSSTISEHHLGRRERSQGNFYIVLAALLWGTAFVQACFWRTFSLAASQRLPQWPTPWATCCDATRNGSVIRALWKRKDRARRFVFLNIGATRCQ